MPGSPHHQSRRQRALGGLPLTPNLMPVDWAFLTLAVRRTGSGSPPGINAGEFPVLGPTLSPTEFAVRRLTSPLAGERIGANVPLTDATPAQIEAIQTATIAERVAGVIDRLRQLGPAPKIATVVPQRFLNAHSP